MVSPMQKNEIIRANKRNKALKNRQKKFKSALVKQKKAAK